MSQFLVLCGSPGNTTRLFSIFEHQRRRLRRESIFSFHFWYNTILFDVRKLVNYYPQKDIIPAQKPAPSGREGGKPACSESLISEAIDLNLSSLETCQPNVHSSVNLFRGRLALTRAATKQPIENFLVFRKKRYYRQ